ncbi:hypothetical protein [Agromyces humi]|uniref:hypothetical protein n=1 Tax=Agromyces humi TaxID=1766800 RepID=UPI001356D999|nr:hypothetical protein [Agromyces humi]
MTITDAHGNFHDTKGLFAGHEHTAAGVTLAAGAHARPEDHRFAAVPSYTKGLYNVESESTNPIKTLPNENSGFVRTVVHMGALPHADNMKAAAAALFTDEERDTAREKAAELEQSGKPFTALVQIEHTVKIAELRSSGHGAFLIKGSRTKGWNASTPTFLAVENGYGKQDKLAAIFDEKAAIVPAADPVTAEVFATMIDEEETPPQVIGHDEDGDEIYEDRGFTHAFLFEGPNFYGPENRKDTFGCVFFATDIQREHGIVNGYLWAPDGAGGITSEHGSQYMIDLERRGGVIRDFQPGSINMKSAWKELPEGRADGYRYIAGER